MRLTNHYLIIIILVAIVILFNRGTLSFGEDNVKVLKGQVDALQKRVEELEVERNQSKSSFTGLFNRRRTQQWDPFEEMQRMQQEMNRMFQDSFRWGGTGSKGIFRNNMYYNDNFGMKNEKDKYVIEFNMTGLNQDNIELQVNQQSITVRGEYSEEKIEEQKDKYFSSKSCATFIRSIPVPEDADITKAKSEKIDNMFVVTLPKKS